MEKIIIFFDRPFKLVPGGFFGLLSFIVGFSFIFIAYFKVPGFSMLENTISSLGVVPGITGLIFNIGLILAGITAIPLFIYLGRTLQSEGFNKNLKKIAFTFSIIICISLCLIGCFPAYNNIIGVFHGLFAGTYFICGLISSILFSFLIWSDLRFSKIQSLISLTVGGTFGFYLITGWPIAEWILLYASLFWVFEISIYTLLRKI
jgi:hypothetical membrane protein